MAEALKLWDYAWDVMCDELRETEIPFGVVFHMLAAREAGEKALAMKK